MTQTDSKKKVIIHIGFHKTGTTALQNCLINNSEVLAANGILYPAGLSNWPSHPELAWSLVNNTFSWQDRTYSVDEVKAHYESIIEETACSTIILSSEELCRLNYYEGSIETLREMFCDFAPHIIAYARSPHEFLASRYRHEVQQGSEARSFADFLADHDNIDSARFDQRMLPWVKSFPGSVSLHYYHRENLIGHNIITDFFTRIGRDSMALKGNYAESEIQIHAALSVFLSVVNRTAMNEENRASIFDDVMSLSKKLGRSDATMLYDELDVPRSTLRMLDQVKINSLDMVAQLLPSAIQIARAEENG